MPIIKSSPWAQQDAVNVSLYNRTITGANKYVVSGELWNLGDNRLTTYALTGAYNIPFLASNKQTVTLASGERQIHGWIYAKNYLVGSTRPAPAKLFRFDPNDLTSYSTINFPNDGFHRIADDVTYVPTTDRAYIAFANSPSGVVVSEINLDTLAYTDVANVAGAVNSTSLVSDGAYLYIALNNFSPDSPIVRLSLSDWTSTTYNISGAVNLHAIRYDGTYLFATTSTSPSSIYRLTTSPFSLDQAQTFFTGDNLATDDFTEAGDYLYVGLETKTGHILRIHKTTFTIDRIATGVLAECYGTYFDGRSVWAGYNTSPGTLVQINPSTLEVRQYQMVSGENSINEIVSDGQRLFLSCWLPNPAKVIRLIPPSLTATTQSFVTLSGGGNFLIDSSAGNVILGGGLNTGSVQISGVPLYQGSVAGPNRYLPSGELSGSSGSVTSLVAGSNLVIDPSPITTTGTIGLSSNPVIIGDLQISGNVSIWNTNYTNSRKYTLHVVGNTDASGLGPVYLRATTSGTIGTGITMDSAALTGGKSWLVLSTGPGAIPGAGAFGLFNFTDSKYAWITFADKSHAQLGNLQVSGITLTYDNIGLGGLPSVPVHIQGDAYATQFRAENSQATGPRLELYRYRGTQNAKTAVSGGDVLGTIDFRGYDFGSDFSTIGASVRTYVDGTAAATVIPTRVSLLVQDPLGNTGVERIAALSTGTRLRGPTQVSGLCLTYGSIISISGNGDPVAPGRAMGGLRWEPGTNAGTLKLVAYAGSSTTGTLIVDNVGAGS